MEIIFCFVIPFFAIVFILWFVGTSKWPEQFQITYIPLLNNQVGSFVFTTVVLLIPILGCCTGFLLVPTSLFEVAEEGWVLLEKPPYPIKSLRAASFDTVYVEMTDGRLMSCYYGSAYDVQCWQEVSEMPDIPEHQCYNRTTTSTFPEPPSSINVTDRIDLEDCMTFAGMGGHRNTSSYVLSDEGQVYQKTQGDPFLIPPLGLIRMGCIFSITGLIVGLLIVFGLMTVNKRRNKLKIISS